MKKFLMGVSLAVLLNGCNAFKAPPRSPDMLVGQPSIKLATGEFLLATQNLAAALGYKVDLNNAFSVEFVERMNLDIRMLQGPARELPAPKFDRPSTERTLAPPLPLEVDKAYKRFIISGQQTATMLCRIYIRGLADRDAGVEALKAEMHEIAAVTTAAFKIFKAASKTKDVFGIANSFFLKSITNYEELAGLKPEITSTLALVTSAQAALAKHYIETVRDESITFAASLNALHNIEHQCSVVGMRSLIDKTTLDAASNLTVDAGGVVRVLPKPKDTANNAAGE